MSVNRHPKIIQNATFTFGVVAVFLFAVGFTFFAFNVYNNPVSADTKSEYLQCSASLKAANNKIIESDLKNRVSVIVGSDLLEAEMGDKLQQNSNYAYTADDLARCKKLLAEAQDMLKKAGISFQLSGLTGSKTTPTTSNSKTPTASKTATAAPGSDYQTLSGQDYSAVAITGLPESPQCKEKAVGQVVVVTDIKDFEASGDKRVEVAVSTGGYYTKRGTLQKISDNYVDKIIEGYKKAKYANSAGIDKKAVVSGLYFPNVPTDSTLKVQLYSPSWGSKSIDLTDIPKVTSACETVFVPVSAQQSKDQDMQVCVHSTDRSKDYSPKKTFTYPKEKNDATKFKETNAGSIISLGPCQDVAALVKKINADQSISDSKAQQQGQTGDKQIGISYDKSISDSSGVSEGAQTALKRLNQFRKEQGKSELQVDQNLQSFADYRSTYISSLTISEIDAAGGHPKFEEHAKAKNIVCAEEVAAGSESDWTKLAEGLIESSKHREGLINSTGKVGISAKKSKDGYILVLELST